MSPCGMIQCTWTTSGAVSRIARRTARAPARKNDRHLQPPARPGAQVLEDRAVGEVLPAAREEAVAAHLDAVRRRLAAPSARHQGRDHHGVESGRPRHSPGPPRRPASRHPPRLGKWTRGPTTAGVRIDRLPGVCTDSRMFTVENSVMPPRTPGRRGRRVGRAGLHRPDHRRPWLSTLPTVSHGSQAPRCKHGVLDPAVAAAATVVVVTGRSSPAQADRNRPGPRQNWPRAANCSNCSPGLARTATRSASCSPARAGRFTTARTLRHSASPRRPPGPAPTPPSSSTSRRRSCPVPPRVPSAAYSGCRTSTGQASGWALDKASSAIGSGRCWTTSRSGYSATLRRSETTCTSTTSRRRSSPPTLDAAAAAGHEHRVRGAHVAAVPGARAAARSPAAGARRADDRGPALRPAAHVAGRAHGGADAGLAADDQPAGRPDGGLGAGVRCRRGTGRSGRPAAPATR